MVAFQTLGELSSWTEGVPGGVQVVDPGVPLTDFYSADGRVDLDVLRKHPSVRKVTEFKARHIALVPFHLFERIGDTDRRRVTGHPLARAMSCPVPGKLVTGYQFRHDLVMDLLLFDRFCAVWSEGRDGELTLTRIPARRFRLVADGLQRVEKIVAYSGRGQAVEIDPARCIYQRGYTTSGANGLSPIETLASVLEEYLESVGYRRDLWRNGARAAQVIERPIEAKWSKEARERFQEDMSDFRKGGAKAGKWLLLEDGMKTHGLDSFRPKDTENLAGRSLTDVEVASAYHVPPELVGAREGTYSNIEAFRQMVYGDAIGPEIQILEQTFNLGLTEQVDPGGSLYLEGAVEAMMRGSFLDQAKYGQTVVGAPTMTRNEWRARMNLPRIDGGDELITPLNVLEGGQASPTDSAPDPGAIDGGDQS